MLDDYLALGGAEIVNSARVYGYARTAGCPLDWVKQAGCATLPEATAALIGVEGEAYTYERIADAPWYDPSLPDLSARFLGCLGLSISGVQNDTRTASITQRFADGGVIGRSRRGTLSATVTVLLVAQGADALDYGVQWLSAATLPGACGQHGDQCGLSDAEFFDACPPEREPDETLAGYGSRVRSGLRFLHDVAVTSGPTLAATTSNGSRDEWAVAEVQFVITAQEPYVFGQTTDRELPATETQAVRDEVTNFLANPALATPSAVVYPVATNLVPNGSFEYGTEGWADVPDPRSEGVGEVTWSAWREVVVEGAPAGNWIRLYRATVTGSEDGTGTVTVTARSNPIPLGVSVNRLTFRGWATAAVTGGQGEVTGVRAEVLRESDMEVLASAELGNSAGDTWDVPVVFPEGDQRLILNIVAEASAESSTTDSTRNTVVDLAIDAIGLYLP